MNFLHKNIFKFIIFLFISIILFWLVYRDQDWSQMAQILRYDVHYGWIILAIVLGMASHVSRAMRWQLVAESMGYRIRFANGFMGVMIGYFANLAIPRMGEFTRCGVVSRYDKLPYAQTLGTVVIERIVDMLLLLIITGVTFILQFNELVRFFKENQGVQEKLDALVHSWWLSVVLVVFLLFCWGVWHLMRHFGIIRKIREFLIGIKEGILSIRHLKHKWQFIGHSVFIWLMYFLMLYVNFFCYSFSMDLGILAGLTVFLLGCYGMIAPVQNGIGAWHFMTIQGLLLYLPHTAENESMAQIFALVAHGTMTITYIIVGTICVIILPIYNRKKGI